MQKIESQVDSKRAELEHTAPATLAETVTLKTMVAVSADTKVLARLHLSHCRVVNFHCVRY